MTATTNTVKHTPDATDSIADDLLRNGYERWLRLEEEKAAIGDDLKELFAELKGQGFTPKALRESFRRVRNIGDANQQEHDAIVDLYVASLTRARPAPAHEKTLNNFGSYAAAKGVETDDVWATASSTNPEMDRATEGSFETGSEAAENARKAGPDGEDGSVSHAGAGESPATNSNSQAIPSKPADTAGEVNPSSRASSATHSDDIDLTIPAFLRRDEGRGYPKREAVDA